jgi:hypothetical protein
MKKHQGAHVNSPYPHRLPNLLAAAILAAIVFSGHASLAEQRVSRETINAGRVSVLTDGLSTSTGRGAEAMLSLARAVSNVGQLRVLAIAGEGGFQNLRDLLFLKGVDFAVLNSDVLTHQELFGPYKNARTHTRLVTKLFDQRIVLFTRDGIGDIRQLEGRAIGVIGADGPGRIAAETIFRLLGIASRIEALEPAAARSKEQLSRLDAVLVLEEELANGAISREGLAAFTPLAIPMTPELAGTYERARLERSFPFGKQPGEDIATLRLATVLSVFNWPANAAQYDSVTRFIEALFKGIVALRQSKAGELWRQAAPTESVPGWQRYGPAVAARWLDRNDVTRIATVTPTRLVEQKPSAAPRTAAMRETEPATPGKIKALVIERPPFHGRKLDDGGILTALLVNSFAGTGTAVEVEWISGGDAAAAQALAEGRHDLLLSSETIDCNEPSGLTRPAAFLCDETAPTLAFMPVVIGLFVAKDASITRLDEARETPLRICLAEGRRVGRLESFDTSRVKLVREPNLARCAGLIQAGEADAFVANELEGRFLIRRLGIHEDFRMLEDPLETRAMHAHVLGSRPNSASLLARINQELSRIKQSDVYSSVVRAHVMAIWGGADALSR